MAESGQHFLRTLGSFMMDDTTNHVVVTTTESADHNISVALKWRTGEGVGQPLRRDGWFIYAEDVSRVWIFDGENLNLVHRTDEKTSSESTPEVDKVCPQAVRDALPESFRKRHFP